MAKSDNANSGKGNAEGQQNNPVETTTPLPSPSSQPNLFGNSVNKLERAENRIQNRETKNEIKEIRDGAEEAENNIDDSLNEMSGRPGFLKFIIGPDYKNAGQIRSEIVRLRNQIAKLTRIKEKLSLGEQSGIDESIKSFETELSLIETKLYESLQGVSLFGWLNKLLSGFSLPTPSPSPVGTLTVTP